MIRGGVPERSENSQSAGNGAEVHRDPEGDRGIFKTGEIFALFHQT